MSIDRYNVYIDIKIPKKSMTILKENGWNLNHSKNSNNERDKSFKDNYNVELDTR